MTDSELIKALENKVQGSDYACFEDYEILDLINRQKAEIERSEKKEIEIDDFCRRLCRMKMLNGDAIASYEDLQNYIQEAKSEAIREFAERLKEKLGDCYIVSDGEYCGFDCGYIHRTITNLLKEMVGEEG